MITIKETWRDIPYYTGTSSMWKIANHYEASSLGRIRNKKTGHILSKTFHHGHRIKAEFPYETVSVKESDGWCNITMRVSHLVYAAFTGKQVDGLRIFHIDDNPCNNAFYNLADYDRLKELGLR